MKIKSKILLMVCGILLITLVIGYFSVCFIIVSMVEHDAGRINNEMNQKWQTEGNYLLERYENLLQMYKDMAVCYAEIYRNDPVVRETYKIAEEGDMNNPDDPDIRRARIKLKKYFKSIIGKENIAGFRLHFHTKNFRSLARVWREGWQIEAGGRKVDVSDDLAEFRNTLKAVKKNRERVTGIEIGREGLVLRGICPVLADNAEYLGSVEYLLPFSEILKKLNEGFQSNYAVYIFKDCLNNTDMLSDREKYPLVAADFIRLLTTDNKLFENIVDGNLLYGFSRKMTGFRIGNNFVSGIGIVDYSGHKVGVLLVTFNISNDLVANAREQEKLLAYVRNFKIIFAIGCIVSFGIIVLLLYVYLSKILSQLEKTTIRLQESEENFKGLFTHQLDGYTLQEIICDENGTAIDYRYLQVNKAFEEQIGIKSEDLKGKKFSEVFPGFEPKFIQRYGKIALEGNTLRFEEYSSKVKRYFEVNAFSPKKGQFACVIRDITKKKEDELEKIKMQEELLYSEKMRVIGQLAGGVAHDFNNKLSVIIGITELLQKKFTEPEDEKMLDMILQAAEYAADLSQKLLAFGKKNFMPFCHLDIQEILADALALLRDTVPDNIVFEENIKADKLLVNGDRSQLFSCFINLGTNAYQAMKGGGVIQVNVSSKIITGDSCEEYRNKIKPGQYFNIEFKDQGRGIPQEHLQRIFEPFFSTRSVGSGNGLGLPATLGVVEHHGGTLRVESHVGIGTSVVILLPCI